jgi:hypothetical protein
MMLRMLPLVVVILVADVIGVVGQEPADGRGVIKHAHNDYLHGRPLLDALELGFGSVEADVILHQGKLLVGHTSIEAISSKKTLEELYLMPLRERVKKNGGKISKEQEQFFLLVDLKTEAESTYQAVHEQLEKYADILSVRRDGVWTQGAVISGSIPRETMQKQAVCYAGIDGRPGAIESDLPAYVMPWISTSWSSMFTWKGKGEMPAEEKEKLRTYVEAAHAKKRLVRFWGTPESEVVWKELREQGVDLIGGDDLKGIDGVCR